MQNQFSITLNNMSSNNNLLAAKYLDKILNFKPGDNIKKFFKTPAVDLENFQEVISNYSRINQEFLENKIWEIVHQISQSRNFATNSELQDLHQFLFEISHTATQPAFNNFQPIFA